MNNINFCSLSVQGDTSLENIHPCLVPGHSVEPPCPCTYPCPGPDLCSGKTACKTPDQQTVRSLTSGPLIVFIRWLSYICWISFFIHFILIISYIYYFTKHFKLVPCIYISIKNQKTKKNLV